ncbi:hypothetical protein [Sphingobacterium detergens]
MKKLENMRSKIFILTFLLIALCKFSFSQPINLETVTFTLVPKKDGVVLLNYNQPTTMRVSVTVSRPITGTWPTLPIKGEVKLWYYNYTNNTEVVLAVLNVSNSDWYSPQHTVSKVIAKDIIIPAGAVSLSKPYMDVSAHWRYYKDGYPSPYNTNGWIDWMDKGYQPMELNLNTIPTTSFTGPSQICSESIYTITNPYTISLENASGVATLTALGNNQWKVSRIGGANGRVILRSTYNGKTFDKEITLGSPASTDIFIDGLQGNLEPNTTYYFQLKPGFSIDSYNWSVIGGTIISGKNSNIVEVRTDPNPYNSLNNFQISLNYSSACGTGTIYHARYVNKGGGDPIDPGE